MPLLYSVGQHRALEAISRLLGSEKLLAYLDDIYVITRSDRVGDVYTAVCQNLWTHACVSINNGKTKKVWNRRQQASNLRGHAQNCTSGRSGS